MAFVKYVYKKSERCSVPYRVSRGKSNIKTKEESCEMKCGAVRPSEARQLALDAFKNLPRSIYGQSAHVERLVVDDIAKYRVDDEYTRLKICQARLSRLHFIVGYTYIAILNNDLYRNVFWIVPN